MNATTLPLWIRLLRIAFLACQLSEAHAATTTFFNATQTAIVASTNATSETLRSGAYLFTHSLDNYWYPTISIGGGTPTGRFQSLFWPAGIHAQAITAGPSGSLTGQGSAKITIKRVDGAVFDVRSFTAKLLANTAGAGASFEIMPKLQGEDVLNDPLALDATGYGGMTFSYTTPTLTGSDSYDISLWVDFALTGITLYDASPAPAPALIVTVPAKDQIRLSWSVDATGYTLQSTPDLRNVAFAATGLVPTVQSGMQGVTISTTNAHRFYRLMR